MYIQVSTYLVFESLGIVDILKNQNGFCWCFLLVVAGFLHGFQGKSFVEKQHLPGIRTVAKGVFITQL